MILINVVYNPHTFVTYKDEGCIHIYMGSWEIYESIKLGEKYLDTSHTFMYTYVQGYIVILY